MIFWHMYYKLFMFVHFFFSTRACSYKLKSVPKLWKVYNCILYKLSYQILWLLVDLSICSYYGKETDTIASLRHTKYVESVTTSLTLRPQNMPPSERAIHFHTLQICQWSILDLECLNLLDWGWYQIKDTIEPIKTDFEAAPVYMLNFIGCNCKTSSKNTRSSGMCSCFRSGLKSVATYGNCRGEFCNNIFEVEMNIEDDIDRNIFDIFEQWSNTRSNDI